MKTKNACSWNALLTKFGERANRALIIGARFVLMAGFAAYFIIEAGLLNPMSSFLYAGIAVMT